MDNSLFALINKAGDASIEELRARSGIGTVPFTYDLSEMLRRGLIDLSSEDVAKNAYLVEIVKELQSEKPEALGKLEGLVADPGEADVVHVMPTKKGFRNF